MEKVKIPESGKVTVALKLPNGLMLRVFKMVSSRELVLGGGSRDVELAQQDGEAVRLNGFAVPFGKTPRFMIVGGYAMTRGVDAQFFKKWMEQNKDSDLVKNDLIYCAAKDETAHDFAEEYAATRSGLEGVDPANPSARMSKADASQASKYKIKIEPGSTENVAA